MDDLKKKFLELLETDDDFRFAVMGMIGVHEILKRLDTHSGIMIKMQEQMAKMQEEIKAMQEQMIKMQEEIKAMQEQMIKMREEINGLRAAVGELRETMRANTEEIKSLKADVSFLKRQGSETRSLLGSLTEAVFQDKALRRLESIMSSAGESVVDIRYNAAIDDKEFDLLIIGSRTVYAVEVKVRHRRQDVDYLLSKLGLAEKEFKGKKVIGVLAGIRMTRAVKSYARGLGMLVI
ncbi:hypothetical protein GCM10007981_03710 [Thermocladium modestius]|uniref:DUF3782 domain-containing protein n=1 Tax=Thermocladium modestius TaxID=62609 RepID=A0A830GS98_9CREN|nr:hypothetical protein [Thermocladium modestius]GGP19554.1 hypothetical protein GCM10007981_03710 [Thermocladium modestius]